MHQGAQFVLICASLLSITGLAASRADAQEQGRAPSYSYFDTSYHVTNLGGRTSDYGIDDNGNGFALEGSLAFPPHVSGFVSYLRDDHEDVDLTIEFTEIGLGTVGRSRRDLRSVSARRTLRAKRTSTSSEIRTYPAMACASMPT